MLSNYIESPSLGEIQELSAMERNNVGGGSWISAGEATGGALVSIGIAIAPETAGAGLAVAAVGGLLFGFCAAADVRLK